MITDMIRPKLPPYQRSKSINSKPTKQQTMISSTILKDLPNGTEPLENQVAGHTFQVGSDEIGNLKFDFSFGCCKTRKNRCGLMAGYFSPFCRHVEM